MICKFFKYTGKGRATGAVDYVMKETDRSVAPVLVKGLASHTRQLCLDNPHMHKYTSGVLSWEKGEVVTPEIEQEIIARFERTAFAGLDPEQYDCLWVRHQDKGRHELHFITPRMELSTGKSLNIAPPNTHQRFYNWRTVVNDDYGFSNPDAPDKKQQIKLSDWALKAQSHKEVKGIVEEYFSLAYQSELPDRDQMILELEDCGFKVTRTTNKSISIKTEDSKRAIRLTGDMFHADNRRDQSEGAGEGTRNSDTASRERDEKADVREARGALKRFDSAREIEFNKHYPNRFRESERYDFPQGKRGDEQVLIRAERDRISGESRSRDLSSNDKELSKRDGKSPGQNEGMSERSERDIREKGSTGVSVRNLRGGGERSVRDYRETEGEKLQNYTGDKGISPQTQKETGNAHPAPTGGSVGRVELSHDSQRNKDISAGGARSDRSDSGRIEEVQRPKRRTRRKVTSTKNKGARRSIQNKGSEGQRGGRSTKRTGQRPKFRKLSKGTSRSRRTIRARRMTSPKTKRCIQRDEGRSM